MLSWHMRNNTKSEYNETILQKKLTTGTGSVLTVYEKTKSQTTNITFRHTPKTVTRTVSIPCGSYGGAKQTSLENFKKTNMFACKCEKDWFDRFFGYVAKRQQFLQMAIVFSIFLIYMRIESKF